MAKAIAHCTCEVCGAEFEMVKRGCYNRTDADNWEEWASEHYTICPDCWKEQQKHAQLEYAIIVDNNKIYPEGIKISLIITSRNAYDRKEELKQYGFKWVDNRWRICSYITDINDIKDCIETLVSDAEEKCGTMKQSDICEYEQIKYSVESGIAIHHFTRNWIKFACEVYAEYKDRLDYPDYPEEFLSMIRGTKWNGKFYGKNKDCIYLDGDKVVLDSDLLQKMNEVNDKRSEYNNIVDEINTAIHERVNEHIKQRRKARLEARRNKNGEN